VAAERGTSVSGLVARELEQPVARARLEALWHSRTGALSLDPPIRGCGWWFLDAAQGVGGGRSRWVTRSRMSGG
jgi:predicted RNA-binding Zn ribbon-like protein